MRSVTMVLQYFQFTLNVIVNDLFAHVLNTFQSAADSFQILTYTFSLSLPNLDDKALNKEIVFFCLLVINTT